MTIEPPLACTDSIAPTDQTSPTDRCPRTADTHKTDVQPSPVENKAPIASMDRMTEAKPDSLTVEPSESGSPAPRGPHAVLPAAEFYWASLEHAAPADRLAPATTRGPRRPSRRALEFQFEEFLPVPIESIACAFIHRPGVTIACGIDRSRLADITTPGTRTLTPASIPPWIDDCAAPSPPNAAAPDAASQAARAVHAPRAAGEARRLNVLTGPDEPPVVRRARTGLLVHAAIALALLTTVHLLGVDRRISHHTADISDSNARAAAAYARVISPATGGQPAAVRLASELRTLERLTIHPERDTSNGPGPAADSNFDASTTLADLLARLPDTPLLTDSLDISPARVTLVALVPTTQDAQILASAWDARPSPTHPWRLRQPQITAERAGADGPSFRVTLALEPADPPPSAPQTPPVAAAQELDP